MENWTAVGARERGRKGERKKRKQESVEEPYFARSSAGVQILNRILDECISLTRLRPVSARESPRLAEEEATARGGYDGGGGGAEGGRF